jgi:hypothetical protein
MMTVAPDQITAPGAAANRALAHLTDQLAKRISLTPRILRHLTAEHLVFLRRESPAFTPAQFEGALHALQYVNARIENALNRYGSHNLTVLLDAVTESAYPEIQLLATRNSQHWERHSMYLYRSAALTVTLQTWAPGQWTAWQGNSCARLAFQVVEGSVQEMRYVEETVEIFTRTRGAYTADPAALCRFGDGNGITLHGEVPHQEGVRDTVEKHGRPSVAGIYETPICTMTRDQRPGANA